MLPHITVRSKGMLINMTLKWVRMAHAWFEEAALAGHGFEPILVDADDVINKPAVMRELATRIGGNQDELIFHWDKVSGSDLESMSSYARTFESTLLASEGIIEGKGTSEVLIE